MSVLILVTIALGSVVSMKIPTLSLAVGASMALAANSTNSSSSGSGVGSDSDSLSYLPMPPPPSEFNQTSSYSPPDNEYDFYDSDTWTLYTTKYRNNSFSIQPYVANGYIGARLPVEGSGFAYDHNETDPKGTPPANGWPLFDYRFTGSYIAGFWDLQPNTTKTNFPELLKRGGESVISTVPVWTSLLVRDVKSNSSFAPLTGSRNDVKDYMQSLSLKNGIVHTNLTWEAHDTTYSFNYTIFAHRTRPSLGVVRLDIVADSDSDIEVSDILDGAGSMRTTFLDKDMASEPAIWTSVKPNGIRNVTAYEYSTLWFSNETMVDLDKRNTSSLASKNESTISQQVPVKLKKGETFTVIKYVGMVSTDAFPVDTFVVARQASTNASETEWSDLLEEHNQAWKEIWNDADIIVPGDEQLQISARSSIYHLLSNVRKGSEGHGLGDNSIPVGGLSSDSYAGLIFWDADLWMYPGLLAMYPEYATSINNYRTRLHRQAELNALNYTYPGALYPWTSARFGNCTGTGPCVDYQYHLNTDVALAHWNYYRSTNDTEWLKETGYPIIRDAADFFASYVVKNSSTHGDYYTFNLTDPDEYANHVNNGAYTNGGIVQLLQWATRASEIVGDSVPKNWSTIAEKMHIPENDTLDLTLEFDGMNGTAAIKQADIVLLTYPLEFNQTDSRATTNLDYYAGRQSADGPAMTYAIFAIDKAQLAYQGCGAYSYLAYAHQPYIRRPFYQFSEQQLDNATINGGTNPAFPFLTGHGGYLQTFTHGFTGFRPREDTLYLDPSLPPQLKDGYMLKGLKFQGGVFDVNVTLTNTTITRRPNKIESLSMSKDNVTSGPITVQIGSRNEKAGNFSLRVNDTLTIPTYRSDANSTLFEGNVAQCVPVGSKEPWTSGHFPFSANDGDNSTFWQPLNGSESSITVDLGSSQSFSSLYFLWGANPPKSLSVGIPQGFHGSNVSQAENVSTVHWLVSNHSISLSNPWKNGTNMSEIVMRPGNDTSLHLNSTFNARFVEIAISGSHEGMGVGGHLTEVSIA